MKSYRRGERGFTIVEALVALIIMGFGILSLAGMQAMLSRNADDAKQRTEAVRLAQEKIEQFRSYTGIASTVIGNGVTSGTALNWNALAGNTDTISTNADYTRTWTISGASGDPMRGLTVNVSWIDRAGAAQTVALSSVLAKIDPADSGFLGFPLPLNTNLKRPKNRSLDIPIPAISLGNGQSAVRFGNTDQFVVFSDVSGDVVKLCTPTGLSGTPTEAQIVAALTSANAGTNGCVTINGYIVAGYVGRDSSISNSDWSAISGGLGINTSAVTRNAAGNTGITCKFGDAQDQNTGAVIANYKYYICVIPLAVPTPPLTVNGPYNWSGTIRIAGPSVWHSSGNRYYVCRYQYVATGSLTDVNQRNVQPYVQVNRSIDQQNYLIAMTGNSTSATTPTCPTSMNANSVALGVLHQDCRSASNPTGFAAACPLLGATTNYTLTYHANSASAGTVPTDPLSPYSEGATVTVLGNTGNLARSGYYFSGWSTTADGSGTAYTAGSSFAIQANTTLYAKWTVAPTYTVTYNGNGASAGSVNDPTTYLAGATATVLPGSALSRSCYTFTGWNTAADGSGTSYAAGATFPIAANTTLYAQWSALPTYTVTYNANNATSGSIPVDTNSPYCQASTVTVKTNSGTLNRTGYSFNGWNTAADGSGTSYSVGATFSISGNVTLYAKWNQITLGTPAPVWGSGNSPRAFSWPAVNGATSYDVYSCGPVTGTTCTPSGTATNQNGTSFQPPNINNSQVVCYKVVARAPVSTYADSAASGTLCMSRAASGNNYNYTP